MISQGAYWLTHFPQGNLNEILDEQQNLTLIFQSTWQVRQPSATIYLTFEIFTGQKCGIYD